ncbi:hypothetical protein PR048_024436 [Dryococelus australis]|uniref:Uncharacterized protein n=1 Tax=Dryococelus australis TaxID=614101 RepID=A0ABQ9GNL2_9NEOP|nr:hypothetical protein PR048_024436 [Dryococelus australis]
MRQELCSQNLAQPIRECLRLHERNCRAMSSVKQCSLQAQAEASTGPAARVFVEAGMERLARSPPTKANRAQSPAGSPDFRVWESCRTTPLVGGFSLQSPVSPAPSFRRRSIFTSITLIGSQDLTFRISQTRKMNELLDLAAVENRARRAGSDRGKDRRRRKRPQSLRAEAMRGPRPVVWKHRLYTLEHKSRVDWPPPQAELVLLLHPDTRPMRRGNSHRPEKFAESFWDKLEFKTRVFRKLKPLVHTVFDTSWRTLAQSSPSSVAADNQCTVDISIFVQTIVESSLQVTELANFSCL